MVGWRSKAKETKAGEVAANGGTAPVAPPDGQEGLAERDGRIAALERRNGELEQEKEGLRREREGLRKENERLRKEQEGLRKEREGLRKEQEGLRKEQEGLRKEREGLRKEREGLRKEQEGLRKEQEGLRKENERLRKENERLRAAVVQGEAQARELQARVGQNSRNSSRPPSTDPPSVPRRALRRQGDHRKPGGQPGHPGHRFPLVPPEQVDHQVPCYPGHCGHCQAPLPAGECAEVGVPLAYQVHDVEIRRRVTQYDQHRLLCPHCGESTLGALPAEAERSQYGPRLTALVAVFSGVSQLARREVSRLCSELCGVSVSVGSVQKLCEQISAAVAAPVEALAAAIRMQPAVGMDETGWRVQHRRRYLWVVCSAIGSIFKIGTRAAKVGQGLLSKDFAGSVMTDRYVGHDWIAAVRRQLCWAHLDRDAQALIDLGVRAAAHYGEGIHRAAKAIFKAWGEFQDAGAGPEARQVMQAALAPVKKRLRPLLLRGCGSRTRKVVNLCSAMESAWESLWLFAEHDGVAPTNNGSERAVRKGV